MAASALRNPLPVSGVIRSRREPSDTRRSQIHGELDLCQRKAGFCLQHDRGYRRGVGRGGRRAEEGEKSIAQGPALLEERGADTVRGTTILGC